MSSVTKLILYGIELSPPVRTVLLTLKALKLDYEFRVIDIPSGEQLKPEYLAKNPQHTVPALEDGKAMLWDSHAIASYLVRKYASDDALYPKDFIQRAIVDQRLHFESGILFHTCLKQITKPLFYENAKQIPEDKIAQINEAYAMLEQFLADNQFMAGNTLTIADFSIVSTVSSLSLAMCAIDASKYPKLMAWLERMAALPYYEEVNMPGAIAFTERVRSFLPKQYDKLWQKAAANIKQSKDKQ